MANRREQAAKAIDAPPFPTPSVRDGVYNESTATFGQFARRRGSGLRNANTVQYLLKTRVGAQRVKLFESRDPQHQTGVAHLVTLLQRF